MRSELATPASNVGMFEKAASSSADLVFLDLEDGTAPSQKESSRQNVADAFRDLNWGATARAIRINDVRTEWAYGDVIEVVETARTLLDVIIIPKVQSRDDIIWVDTLLNQLEQKLRLDKRVHLEALIEDVVGLQNVKETATASSRLDALIFGVGDYSNSQQAVLDSRLSPGDRYPGDIWHYARSRILVAARAAQIEAIDCAFIDVGDVAGLKAEAEMAHALGYTGKWALHPGQLETINSTFSPSDTEIAYARRVVAALEEAEERGLGATSLDGLVIDVASGRWKRELLSRAALIAKQETSSNGDNGDATE